MQYAEYAIERIADIVQNLIDVQVLAESGVATGNSEISLLISVLTDISHLWQESLDGLDVSRNVIEVTTSGSTGRRG